MVPSTIMIHLVFKHGIYEHFVPHTDVQQQNTSQVQIGKAKSSQSHPSR